MKTNILIIVFLFTVCLTAQEPILDYNPQIFDIELPQGGSSLEYLNISNLGDETLYYTLNLCAGETRNDGREIDDSELTCNQEDFMPGSTVTWIFNLHNNTTDDENFLDVIFYFPEQVVANSAGDFIGGSGGVMEFLPEISTSNMLMWHGEDGEGNGVIHNGDTAVAEINVTIDPCYYEDLDLEYFIYGDNGNVFSGVYTFRTLCIGWCFMSCSSGELEPGESDTIELQFCAGGLGEGLYSAAMIITDSCREQYEIPIYLTVLLVDNDNNNLPVDLIALSNTPNPFNPFTTIFYTTNCSQHVRLSIYNIKGEIIRNLQDGVAPAGEHELVWDGTDASGKQLPSGIYFCNLSTTGQTLSRKLCLLK
ncbi:MAG: T9SS type A sorting domain-containing protein [Candidatus Cloacimonetes bacterium]|nr:T9SS type A sorting domain-containing protein [Candidatus Cloacimonadota bacterium]